MNKLMQFTVGNFRSFKEKTGITMAATSIKDRPASSVFEFNRNKLLSVSALYGANSSGKSNLVLAIKAMQSTLLNNARLNDGEVVAPYEPFLLNIDCNTHPSYFEIVFLSSELGRIRYGFEFKWSEITAEWLFIQKSVISKGDEIPCFTRKYENIWVNENAFPEGIDREENTNGNRFFLSVVAQLGGKISKEIISFFQKDISVISGLSPYEYLSSTRESFVSKDDISKKAMAFFRHLDLGFTDINIKKREDHRHLPESLRYQIATRHNSYDYRGNVCNYEMLDMMENESAGTQKIFDMAAPLFKTLEEGGLLVVDELDAKMHPLISQEIIRLFTEEETNPNHAQLIFTTHDTNLLSAGLLRRDEIWLTEKNPQEATELYRLMDVSFADGSKPRNDANLERNYIRGRYGAIPFIRFEDFCNGL